MPEGSPGSIDPLSRPQRLLAGVLLLLLVDIIWVASSEFTEYIFKDLHYDKPFFSTYFKTSLFVTYLLGFLVYRPWREECRASTSSRPVVRVNSNNSYHRVHVQEPDDEEVVPVLEEDGSNVEEDEDHISVAPAQNRNGSRRMGRTLSSPSFVPANIPESGKSSGTEESDVDGSAASKSRRVRFKQVAEVVEMNPAEAIAANLARLSYTASLRAQAALRRAAQRLRVAEVARLALVFCVPWFAGNYCYQAALSATEAAVVNVLSSASGVFTLLLAALFPSESSDRLSLSKFCAVCFSASGVVVVSYSDLHVEDASVPKGAIWALAGAVFYSVYIVLLRRKVSHEDNMDAPMFFGFVGLFNTALLWPGILVVHLVHNEQFEWPTVRQWEFLVVNGLIGTVLSELLWLWGCFYTSSLIATLAVGLTIPLSIMADVLWKQKTYEPIFLVGAVPMFVSFFIIALLTHYEDWDPLLDLCKKVFRRAKLFLCCRPRGTSGNSYVFDRHERESLINQDQQSSSQDEPL